MIGAQPKTRHRTSMKAQQMKLAERDLMDQLLRTLQNYERAHL
jgi:hypothetical protein